MVNNDPRLLVSGACETTANASGRTIITNGPVYDLVKVKALLKVHGLRVVNEDANEDMLNEFMPELDDDELAHFIGELTADDFKNSERCRTSGGMTVDSDAYAMQWNRATYKRWMHGQKIYVKFGFYRIGLKCLVVSVHPARW